MAGRQDRRRGGRGDQRDGDNGQVAFDTAPDDLAYQARLAGRTDGAYINRVYAQQMAFGGTTFTQNLAPARTPAALTLPFRHAMNPSFGMLVYQKGNQALADGDLFPLTRAQAQGMSYEGVFANAFIVPASREGTVYEVGLRAALMALGVVPDTCVMEAGDPFGHIDSTQIRTFLGLADRAESISQVMVHSFALLMLVAQRPYVSSISDGVYNQYREACAELHVHIPLLPKSEIDDLLKRYIRRLDFTDFIAQLQAFDFSESPRLQALARRYSAGSSHLSAIMTALQLEPLLPFWSVMPQAEWINFRDAVIAVHQDPLCLHPTRKVDPALVDRFRATAMPTLLSVSLFVLIEKGQWSWATYGNVPHFAILAGMTRETVQAEVIKYCSASEAAKRAQFSRGPFAPISAPLEYFTPDQRSAFTQLLNRDRRVQGARQDVFGVGTIGGTTYRSTNPSGEGA